MVMTNTEFTNSLTRAEKQFLWSHVYRYADEKGVERKFARLVEYVLNFLTGNSKIENQIYVKAILAKF